MTTLIQRKLLLAAVLAVATTAPAQAQQNPSASSPVAQCLVCVAPVSVQRIAAGGMTTPLALSEHFTAPPPETLPRRVGGAIFGAVWGGLAGLVLGYAIGTQVERSCDGPCAPGLGGALLGAAIGIVVGGTVGALVVDE